MRGMGLLTMPVRRRLNRPASKGATFSRFVAMVTDLSETRSHDWTIVPLLHVVWPLFGGTSGSIEGSWVVLVLVVL